MAEKPKSGTSSDFHVAIDGLKLSAEAQKRIELEIRRVVLAELALVDHKGDLQVGSLNKFPNLIANTPFRPGGGHTAGIYIRDIKGI